MPRKNCQFWKATGKNFAVGLISNSHLDLDKYLYTSMTSTKFSCETGSNKSICNFLIPISWSWNWPGCESEPGRRWISTRFSSCGTERTWNGRTVCCKARSAPPWLCSERTSMCWCYSRCEACRNWACNRKEYKKNWRFLWKQPGNPIKILLDIQTLKAS